MLSRIMQIPLVSILATLSEPKYPLVRRAKRYSDLAVAPTLIDANPQSARPSPRLIYILRSTPSAAAACRERAATVVEPCRNRAVILAAFAPGARFRLSSADVVEGIAEAIAVRTIGDGAINSGIGHGYAGSRGVFDALAVPVHAASIGWCTNGVGWCTRRQPKHNGNWCRRCDSSLCHFTPPVPFERSDCPIVSVVVFQISLGIYSKHSPFSKSAAVPLISQRAEFTRPGSNLPSGLSRAATLPRRC
jgi:hypothetical protein